MASTAGRTKPVRSARDDQRFVPADAETRSQRADSRASKGPVLASLDEDDGTCSLILNVDNQQLFCHKDFLCIWSPVIKELCKEASESNEDQYPLEVDLEDKDVEEVREFLQCLYPPNKEVTESNVDSISALASEFKTENLRDKCEQVLMSRDASCELMLTGEVYSMQSLREETAKRMAEKTLKEVEDDEGFNDLNDESKMMLWRERALKLESETEQVAEIGDKVYQMTKFIAKKHPCKNVAEDRFTSVTAFSTDARGRKVKETIENACYVKLSEVNNPCNGCFHGFGKNAIDRVGALDRKGAFDKIREYDNSQSIHFHASKH